MQNSSHAGSGNNNDTSIGWHRNTKAGNKQNSLPNDRDTVMGCLHDPANVQQTSSKCIQNTRANAGRLLDRVNTL